MCPPSDWYEPSGVPGFHATGASADMRSELSAVKAGLSDKLPLLTGRANRPVFVDETGTMLESISISDALALLGLNIGVNAAVCTGTANAYAATITGITAYTNLQRLTLQIPIGNTTTVTFNINGLGLKYGCRLDGADLEDGDLATNGIYDFCYNSTFGKLVLMTMMPSTIQSSNPTFTTVNTTTINATTIEGDTINATTINSTTIEGDTISATSLDADTITAITNIATSVMEANVVKTGLVPVTASAGNITLDLSAGSAFELASMTSDLTVTLTNFDVTKQVTFTLDVTTTGSYNFTSLIMSGVTIYKDENMITAGTLKANGNTIIGFKFNGTTLKVISNNQVPN